MPNTRLSETLVILDARKLTSELLQTTFTTTNTFSRVRVAEDWPSPVLSAAIDGPVVFLIVVHSYLRACQTTQRVQNALPDATIVILDEQFRSGSGLLVRNTIAHGYWTFQDTVKVITQGIIQASRRSPSISPCVNKYLRHSRRKGVQIAPNLREHPFYKLSKRERQLFHLIACGKKIEACAEEMNIAKKTACNLRKKLMKKFNVKSGTDLVWKAIEIGLVDPISPRDGNCIHLQWESHENERREPPENVTANQHRNYPG